MARDHRKTVKKWPKDVRKPSDPLPVLPVESLGINVALLMGSQEPKDQAYLGTLMEDFLKGTSGEFVCRIIHLMKARAARMNAPADERIGRIQQLEELLDTFEAYVTNSRRVKSLQEDEDEAKLWERMATNGHTLPPSQHGAGETE